MREKSNRHDGSTFTLEKILATIYATAFVAIVGIGVHSQLKRIMPSELGATSLASTDVAKP